MLTLRSNSPEETEDIGSNLAKKLSQKLTTVAIYGDLSAGKTTFVRGFARGFGCINDVTSPTFSLLNEYNGEFYLYHFDMYRIHSLQDLISTGFFDLLGVETMIIEWSENIDEYLPQDVVKVVFEKDLLDENKRTITINYFEKNFIC
ncbi:MAG: tRNA (adenosine(37)-N6)-threonylcarbamoyltransferase complex ATPase subunit type 1 TsaE [Oscillospiraceae bacterium]|nr:tRNA (adenosine(37)-N6)-threonylcarbamoyltransferase complex ATPase subunit type 1 TsaE [Oscillospiraceae bacterium]